MAPAIVWDVEQGPHPAGMGGWEHSDPASAEVHPAQAFSYPGLKRSGQAPLVLMTTLRVYSAQDHRATPGRDFSGQFISEDGKKEGILDSALKTLSKH